MTVLWVGHEAECYALTYINQTENSGASIAPYERTGMRVGRSDQKYIRSAPDWATVSEFWHTFRIAGANSVGQLLWFVENAGGTILARITMVTTTTAQLQISDGAGGFTNVGAVFDTDSSVHKGDIHVKGGNPGKLELYYGSPGSQAKVVDATGNFTVLANMVRVGHQANNTAGGFDTSIAHEVVQTTPTLSTTSEVHPPTSMGADTNGTGTFASIDEANYDDSDFVTLLNIGDHQSYKSPARTNTQQVVSGVTVSGRLWYEAGGPTKAKPYLTIGGVRYYGTIFTLDLIPLSYQYTWQVNPATGIAFTGAESDAATLEWGWEAVA